MGGHESKQNVSIASTNVITTTTGLFHTTHPRQRIEEHFLVIWVDASIDDSKQDYQNTLAQLRSVVNDVEFFTQPDQCIQFLHGIENEKAFIITSGSLGQHLVPDIHALPQIDAIYIFCGNKSNHKQWTKEWAKIKGIHMEIEPICEALQLAAKQCNQDSITVSIIKVGEGASNGNLNQLEPSFMYTQILKEILHEIERGEQSIKDLAVYCRKFYNDNMTQFNVIREFEEDYRSKTPIWWYTRECFIYQMLNRALRTLEGGTIIHMGFFIRDLHQQIEQLHQTQVNNYHGKPFTVYRGQGLLKTNFEKLLKSKNGLMSFDNFLSTSMKRDVSLVFAESASTKTNMVGILFKMTIDPSVSSAPFASIQDVSYFQVEEEILFSIHTVFRIDGITKIGDNSSLYQVDLKLTADDDQELRILTDRIRKEVVGKTGWKQFGQLLIKLGQFDKAEELYNVLLEQTPHEDDKALYYNQLGYVKDYQSDYERATEYFKKALEIKEKTLPPNHPSLASSYNNIGSVYNQMREYLKALSFYGKALEIYEKTLRPNHPSLATSYNNIGSVYNQMGEYSKALSFYEKVLENFEKTLPPNHPSLATSYNNIGSVYDSMGEYSKALSYFERAQNIWQSSLPPTDPQFIKVQESIEIVKKKL